MFFVSFSYSESLDFAHTRHTVVEFFGIKLESEETQLNEKEKLKENYRLKNFTKKN